MNEDFKTLSPESTDEITIEETFSEEKDTIGSLKKEIKAFRKDLDEQKRDIVKQNNIILLGWIVIIFTALGVAIAFFSLVMQFFGY